MDGFVCIDANEENKSWYTWNIILCNNIILVNRPFEHRFLIVCFTTLQMQYEVVEEIIHGLESGILFG